MSPSDGKRMGSAPMQQHQHNGFSFLADRQHLAKGLLRLFWGGDPFFLPGAAARACSSVHPLRLCFRVPRTRIECCGRARSDDGALWPVLVPPLEPVCLYQQVHCRRHSPKDCPPPDGLAVRKTLASLQPSLPPGKFIIRPRVSSVYPKYVTEM